MASGNPASAVRRSGWLAASLGHVGQLEEAQKVWAELLEIDPSFDTKTRLSRFGFSRHRHPPFASRRVNTVEFHQLGDGFLGDLVAVIPHVCMDTGRAVPLFACLENRTDFIDKQVVFGGTIRSGQRCVAPGMEPATADAEHTAHQADCVIDSMGSYEIAFGPHVFAAH